MTNQSISSGIRSLILDEPFFGSLALRLEIRQDTSIPTFATDGTHLLYNPQFAASCSPKEITFILAHEVLHCALGHIWRRNSRDPEKWNIACDIVVNAQLHKHIQNGSQAMAMPPCAIHEPSLAHLSAEAIYTKLPDSTTPQQQPSTGSFTDPPGRAGCPQHAAPTPGCPQPAAMSESEWKIAAKQAQNAQNASGQGHTPSEIERLINEFITPTIPWHELLREFTNQITRDDYTWSRPNRRYTHTGFALPTLHTQSVGDIIIAIDTSGSVPDKLLARFLSETQHLLDTAKPASITILSCDSTVKNPRTYHHGDTLTTYTPQGGGGTRFTPVFDHIEEHHPDPLALIYFTDGQGRFPSKEPHYPTLWLHHGRKINYPFGQTITIPPTQ